MPKGQKRGMKRKFITSVPFARRIKDMSQDRKISKLAKKVKSLTKMSGEQIAVIDRNWTSTLTANMIEVFDTTSKRLFNCATGDDDDSREGKSIKQLNCSVRGSMDTTAQADTYIRFMVLRWREVPGDIASVLQYPTGSVTYGNPQRVVMSPYTRDPLQKYTVLVDKVFKITKYQDTSAYTATRLLKEFIKLKMVESNYTNTTAEDPDTNQVRIYACYGKTSTQHSAPKLSFFTRERFVK